MDEENNKPIMLPTDSGEGLCYIQTDRDGNKTITVMWFD